MTTTIITTDTTWRVGETINLTGLVQIAPGVTLTIEPGAIVNGNNQTIQTFGTLRVVGSANDKVDFNDTLFTFGSNTETPGRIEISHAKINGGAFLPATGNASYGSFSVTDSNLTSVDGFYIWYPTSASSFERNVFLRSEGLSIGTRVEVKVTNNVFAQHNGPAIENWASYGGTHVIVEHNSFLSTDLEALRLPDGYTSSAMLAEHNYFGTTDLANIAARVYDRTDSLNAASVIDYDPILTQAHADTPTWPSNYAPTGDVTITGAPAQGQTLTAANTLADADGLGAISYQWNANGSAISGATGSTYTLTQAEVGKTISVTASYTDGQGAAESKTSAATDVVASGHSSPNLVGDAGNNRFSASPGNDYVDGGDGLDAFIYGQAVAMYSVQAQDQGFVIAGPEGTDVVINVERLKFADKTVALDIDGNAGDAYRLYKAAFNRMPDEAGLGYWIREFDNGMTLAQASNSFIVSEEFQSLYGADLTNQTFLEKIYQNVLGRDYDQAGFDYWLGELESGVMSRDWVLAAFSESAENKANVIGQISNGFEYIEYLI